MFRRRGLLVFAKLNKKRYKQRLLFLHVVATAAAVVVVVVSNYEFSSPPCSRQFVCVTAGTQARAKAKAKARGGAAARAVRQTAVLTACCFNPNFPLSLFPRACSHNNQ